MEVVNLDIDVKKKIETHDRQLDNHEERIKDLEFNNVKTNEQLHYMSQGQDELKQELKEGLQRMENTNLSNYNNILSMLSQLIMCKENNETQKSITKANNWNKIIIQILIIVGGIFAGAKLF